MHTSVTCTFRQNMYPEFDSARESRMVCGCGRAPSMVGGLWEGGTTASTWSCTGKLLGGLWACFVAWYLPVGAGKLHQASLPSFPHFSAGVGRMSPFIPVVPHFPSGGEGQPVGIPIGKGLRKGLVILTWNNAGHPPELTAPTWRRQPPLPPALGRREHGPAL